MSARHDKAAASWSRVIVSGSRLREALWMNSLEHPRAGPPVLSRRLLDDRQVEHLEIRFGLLEKRGEFLVAFGGAADGIGRAADVLGRGATAAADG